MIRQLAVLALLGLLGFTLARGQYVSGIPTAPNAYSGVTIPFGAILHLHDVVFGNYILHSEGVLE